MEPKSMLLEPKSMLLEPKSMLLEPKSMSFVSGATGEVHAAAPIPTPRTATRAMRRRIFFMMLGPFQGDH